MWACPSQNSMGFITRPPELAPKPHMPSLTHSRCPWECVLCLKDTVIKHDLDWPWFFSGFWSICTSNQEGEIKVWGKKKKKQNQKPTLLPRPEMLVVSQHEVHACEGLSADASVSPSRPMEESGSQKRTGCAQRNQLNKPSNAAYLLNKQLTSFHTSPRPHRTNVGNTGKVQPTRQLMDVSGRLPNGHTVH